MEIEQIWKSIENAKVSLFRYEGLQDYSGEDGNDSVETFRKTGTLLELPNDSNEWWRRMKERNERGLITQRVRLVVSPLNDYTNMELAYLKKASQYSGDDIRIIEENVFAQMNLPELSDFWMIDEKYVFRMEYGHNGKYLSSELAGDGEVQEYIDIKNKLLHLSVKI